FSGPNFLPELTVPRVEAADVRADGFLDEPIWSRAAVATGFSENFPEEQAEPPIGIKAFMAYDAENLYVAYIIQDDPKRIRVNMSERDQIWQDDYSGFILDTNGDGQVTYFIAANALGIQGDTRSGNGNEDVSFDLIYYSGGQVTETGYQVELVVPFRSLRFPPGEEHSWRLTHWITHPRESRNTYTWAAIDRDDPCMSCQLGTVSGMRGIRSGRNLEILPSLTGSQCSDFVTGADQAPSLDANRITAEPSLNVKYGITSDLTADVTLNPDFSQIESDAAQIDVNSTFALSFPERRAFFQEGADLFDTEIDVVYTRSINDPSAAGKLSGRFGDWTVGYIGGRDEQSPILMPFEESSRLVSGGQSFSNIVRARRSFANSSFVGGTVTDRRLDEGGSGSTAGIDGSVRFLTKYRFEFQAVGSQTSELNAPALDDQIGDITFGGSSGDRYSAALDGESFSGHALYTEISRNARHYGFDVSYEESSPTFRTANGFVTQNNRRQVELENYYTFWPEDHPVVDRLSIFTGASRIWNFDGVRKDEFAFVGLNSQLKGQTFMNVNFFVSNELFRGIQFDGIRGTFFHVNSNFSERVGFGFGGTVRRSIRRSSTPEMGREMNLRANLSLRPTTRLRIQPSVNFSRMTALDSDETFFSGFVARTRVNYQITRKLSTRLITQYNDFAESLEVDPLVTYRVNAFTVLHLGSTHRYRSIEAFNPRFGGTQEQFLQTDRQIFFKLQYLLRR
ncbi:MAG: carbohydrate binding family 9 domain-containing protein, partial [Rhodothermales bacterium]|nr:carbohydrate binding family 9 domain-containing protein [Rhodothermales bacterium]